MEQMPNASTEVKKPKKFKIAFPHTYLILVALCALAVILTNVLPSGVFDRERNADGRTVVIAGTYHEVEANPIPFIKLPVKIHEGMQAGADLLMFMLIMGGSFGILNEAGAVNFFICNSLARAMRGKEKLFIPILLFVMSMGGITFGMAVEAVAFIPAVIALSIALGYDSILGLAIVFLGSNAGYTDGIYNPFNVGVAHSLAEIPLYEGAWYRWIFLFVLLMIASIGLMRYADRIKKDPTKSLVYKDPDSESWRSVQSSGRKATIQEYLGLFIFLGGFALIIWGCVSQGWWFGEISAAFFWMAVLTGIIFRFTPNKMCRLFCSGMSDIAVGAGSVGFARAIAVILADGVIMDTIVYYLAMPLQYLPGIVQAAGMQVAQTIINLGLPSGSAQATATMPIIIPLADLLGVSRQTAVFAFQCGDGISNGIIPTYTTLIAMMAAAKIPFQKWLKLAFKIVAVQWLAGMAMTIIATLIHY